LLIFIQCGLWGENRFLFFIKKELCEKTGIVKGGGAESKGQRASPINSINSITSLQSKKWKL